VHLTGSASTSAFDEIVTTDSSGKYSSGSIPGGTYQVSASANGFSSSAATASLANGATVTQNFALSGSGTSGTPPPSPSPSPTPSTSPGVGTVTGQVVKDDTAVPLAGAMVSYTGGSTTANSSGAYTLSNVPAGSSIAITASAAGYSSAAKTVAVASSSTSTANFALLPVCTISTTNLTVTTCEPTANSTVLNPVHIIAQATDTTTVNHLEVWVEGVKVYQLSGGSINTSLSMSTGVTHRITVQAVDNSSHIFKQTVYATVH
jgi:Carboxypeptidase regulatory-like domain